MAPPPSPPNLSLLIAQAALSLSRTQRLVSSWLPPPTNAELRAPSDPDHSDDNIFTASNELAGLGAKYTEEDEHASKVLRSDEKLKIQLMGRDWVKRQERRGGMGALRGGSKAMPAAEGRRDGGREESEDEVGRSEIGRVKGGKSGKGEAERGGMDGDGDGGDEGARMLVMPVVKRPLKRGGSYLDEVLAQKAEKERNKRRRKGKHSSALEHVDDPDDL